MRLTWSLAIVAAALVACSTPGAGDGSWTPAADPGPVDRSRGCLAVQRSEVPAVTIQLQKVIGIVLRAEEPQQEPADRLRSIVRQTERRLQERCDGHTDLTPMVDVVENRVGDARGALDEPTLRVVVRTFRDWAREVGALRTVALYYHRTPCVPFRRGLEVSIDTERRATAAGSVARAWLVVRNDLRERVYVEHGGTIRVDGRPALHWGGSSADTAAARSGRTIRTPIWPARLPTRDIPVGAGGSLEFSDVYAVAYSRILCRVDVDRPRAS